jgi:hypothetical protein
MKAAHARRQRAAVEALGATAFVYDFEVTHDANSNEHYIPAGRPPGPAIIRLLWGEYVFANIVDLNVDEEHCKGINPTLLRKLAALDTLESLSLEYQPVRDSDLEWLSRLPNLKELNLSGTDISDETLQRLSGMRCLEKLRLSHTKITGVGLVYLRNCSRLKELWVSDVPLTPEGGRAIANLVALEKLHARMNKIFTRTPVVGDEILEGCGNLQHLEWIDVVDRPVTDAGVRHLRGLPRLWSLLLDGTRITDQGLAHIAAVPSLSSLDIGWTHVTDAGLVHLQYATRLELLHLQGNPISDDGICHLRGLNKLTVLDLQESLVSDHCLQIVKDLPSLEWCSTENTAVTGEGRKQIEAALSKATLR